MKQFSRLESFPSGLPSPFVTIGNFDGVHLGHQMILKRVTKEALAARGCSVVISFSPHPLQIVLPDTAPPLIMTTSQKLAALSQHDIDYVLIIPFDEEVSRWSPRHFVERILVHCVAARKVFVGSDFVFGYQQRGNLETLQFLGKEFNLEVEGIPQYTWRQTRVSSSLIRGYVREGNVAEANRLLGRYFTLEGGVIHGAGRGQKVTVPTLNLAPQNELIPKTGVYITQTSFQDATYPSVTNVGTRPTFDESTLSIESHLIDLAEIEAPSQISISFFHRLRDEKKFSSPIELKNQIGRDVRAARKFFTRLKRFTGATVSPRRT
ncbi:MAG: bifunctional riboflavin kinase/FAD synthetase [Acidobacteriia bacterium]|nr:bifunctional riboflavin kinase/FAD synthetase [Terriglobia bacterium]